MFPFDAGTVFACTKFICRGYCMKAAVITVHLPTHHRLNHQFGFLALVSVMTLGALS